MNVRRVRHGRLPLHTPLNLPLSLPLRQELGLKRLLVPRLLLLLLLLLLALKHSSEAYVLRRSRLRLCLRLRHHSLHSKHLGLRRRNRRSLTCLGRWCE